MAMGESNEQAGPGSIAWLVDVLDPAESYEGVVEGLAQAEQSRFRHGMAEILASAPIPRDCIETAMTKDFVDALVADPAKSDVVYDPEKREATFVVSGPPALKSFTLAPRTAATFGDDCDGAAVPAFEPPPNSAHGVPYRSARSYEGRWNAEPAATDIHLFMIVTRWGSDHGITYALLEGAPSLEAVTAWVERNPETLSTSAVVIDLGKSFATVDEAADEASRLREAMPRVNVMSGRLS